MTKGRHISARASLGDYWIARARKEQVPGRRRRELLLVELSRGPIYPHPQRHAIWGGVSIHDKELRRLLENGLAKLRRIPYSRGWGGKYLLRRTRVEITDKGWQALFEEDMGTIRPTPKSLRKEKRSRHV